MGLVDRVFWVVVGVYEGVMRGGGVFCCGWVETYMIMRGQ